MKKLIVAFVFLASTSMVSFAQNVASTHAQAEKAAETRAKASQKQLGLTKEQYDVVYKAELNYAEQEFAAKANGGQPGPGQSMQMQMGRDQQYKAALTAAQYAKYDATKPKVSMPGATAEKH